MVTIRDIIDFADSNKKLVRTDQVGDLRLFKYSKYAHINKVWTPELCEMRGTVIDVRTHELVSYPFSKFFNVYENELSVVSEDDRFEAVEKRNGFLAVVTVHNGKLLYHTAGSLNGDYKPKIAELLDEQRFLDVLDSRYTYMFEVIHPNDYHVTEEAVGLHLLGYREKFLGSPVIHDEATLTALARRLGVHTPKHYHGTLAELRIRLKDVDIEGYVLYRADGQMFKLKAERFLTKRFISYMSSNKLARLTEQGVREADEEFEEILTWILNHKENFDAYTHEERVLFVRRWFSRPIAFMMVGLPYSGKSTYVNRIDFLRELPQVSMDDEVERLCRARGLTYNTGYNAVAKEAGKAVKARVRDLIERQESFVWDGTNLTKKSRAKKLARLKANHYTVVAIVMPALNAFDEANRRLGRLDKIIEDPILESMRESFEAVTFDEGFDLVYNVEKGD